MMSLCPHLVVCSLFVVHVVVWLSCLCVVCVVCRVCGVCQLVECVVCGCVWCVVCVWKSGCVVVVCV